MMKNDCKKFSANIFNKNKCANCYRIREQHSSEALEVNKATRIITKCGYLSVAPNWGENSGENGSTLFSNAMSRTPKRWQRRWFVLYDDGELTYSVDEHPDTVPQAVINMNNCFEVAEADSITGNEHSIAIVAPDGIHFVKGSCKEESRMWINILKLLPNTSISQGRGGMAGGRAKRSQTFPGLRSFGNPFPVPINGPNLSTISSKSKDPPPTENSEDTETNGSVPTTGPTTPPTTPTQSPPPLEEHSASTSNGKSSASTTSPLATRASPRTEPSSSVPQRKTSSASLVLRSSVVERVYLDKGSQYDKSSTNTSDNVEPAKKRYSGTEGTVAKKRSGASSSLNSVSSFRRNSNPFGQDITSTYRRTSVSSTELSPPATEGRGSPDGCGLQDMSTSPSSTTPEIMSKKGWLMKLGLTKEWHKYWFVLQDVALLYYRDPSAESMGFLDGIVDLGLVRRIEKRDLARHFGFSVETYEGKTTVFSAITDGIRNSWITCLKKAAGLENQEDETTADDETNKFDFGKSRSSFGSSRTMSRSSFDADLPVITTARLVRNSSAVTSPNSSSNIQRNLNFSTALEETEDSPKRDRDETKVTSPKIVSSSSSGDGILVDLLETEVDSLKAQLEKTQSDLVCLHQSNIDLESQLRQQNSGPPSNGSGKRFHHPNASSGGGCVSRVIADPDEGEALSKAKSTVAKQSAEILSLRNQLGLLQLQLKQRTESLQIAENSLSEMSNKLRVVEDSSEKECDRMRREFERSLSQGEKEVEKWKMLYESTYLQYDRELHSWQEKLGELEKEREVSNSAFAEEERRKEQIISDLSVQLKESEERIQELLVELESIRERNDDLTYSNQETMCRLVVSMEEKFEKSLQYEKEQLELAFREKLKDAEVFAAAACANSRRPSVTKITSMSDLLSIQVPSLESIEKMEREDIIEKYLILLDHFYRAIEEIRRLRVHLREAHDSNDQLELEKLRFEESFKRTIVMQEQQESLMTKRIQDLTNKLLVSEKSVKQLKERRHSKKNSILNTDRSGNSSSQNNE